MILSGIYTGVAVGLVYYVFYGSKESLAVSLLVAELLRGLGAGRTPVPSFQPYLLHSFTEKTVKFFLNDLPDHKVIFLWGH